MRNGTFEAVDVGTVLEGTRIFGSHFIEEFKKTEKGLGVKDV